jgi:hypothetical protein
MNQNTHESIPGVVGKRPVTHRFESQSPRLRLKRIAALSRFFQGKATSN